jgi:hypothetical protein
VERVPWPSGGQRFASRATHAGKSAVQELGTLSNETGSFQGSQIGEVPEGVFWLRILADGNWSVQMREV